MDLLALLDSHVPDPTQATAEEASSTLDARSCISFARAAASAFGRVLTLSEETLADGDDDAMLGVVLEVGVR